MKKIIERILKVLAKGVLKRQKPQLVTVTGSFGKTSTKEAIYFVLRKKLNTRKSLKNYNNELGVPLTILGEVSPGKFIFGWLKVFLKGIFLTLFKRKNYPQVLVLEIGADKPGDLKYLMEILRHGILKAAFLTAVGPVHLEAFGGIENVLKEKCVPFSFLKKEGVGVINKDDCPLKVEEILSQKGISFFTYSLNQKADIQVKDFRILETGIEFNILYQNQEYPLFLKEGVGVHQLYPLLAGFLAGIIFGFQGKEIRNYLKDYRVVAGRMKKIKGKKGALIIDDTYNSSPIAAKRALEALVNFPFGKRKIAVLGDMLELGKFSKKFHEEIGEWVARLKIDYLITFGKEAEFIFEGAVKKGMAKERVFKFKELGEIVAFLKDFIKKDDLLLVKGSQGMRMEKIVKELMAEPEKAKEILVRQTKEWQKT